MNVYGTYQKCLSYVSDFATKWAWKRETISKRNASKRIYKDWKPLSGAQKKEIAEYWHIKHPEACDYITHEIMLNVKGVFDVKYCPESVFRLKLDDDKLYRAWTDKNYYERFIPGLPMAHTYVRNVNGCFLDYDYKPITKEEAKAIILAHLPLIVKPSLLSGQGRNIRLVENEKDADEVLSKYDRDYLLQELIVQCDELCQISPHSVASIRLITAMVNGTPVVLKKHLLGNVTDSVAVNSGENSGSGVVIIKVDDDGKLDSVGYYEDTRTFTTLPSGIAPGNTVIPAFKEAAAIALNAHKTVPMLDFIGWDITVNKDNKPVIIEWNLRNLEVFHTQLTQGPLFGEYTDYFVKKISTTK